MVRLPQSEFILFIAVNFVYLAATVVGVLQVIARRDSHRGLITHFIAIGVAMEAVLLILRAITVKGLPLTGSFESMIVLTTAFGLAYLIIGVFIRQIWFAAVMSWTIMLMILLTALAAEPATEPNEVASTPFAMAHGIAMILGEVMVLVASVAAWIYLIANRRLKRKNINNIIGIIPNLQKLRQLNRVGLTAGFVFVSLGLISGLGMAYLSTEKLGISMMEWLTDIRILLVFSGWWVLLFLLLAQHFGWISTRWHAWVTLVALLLILIALMAQLTNVIKSKHDFEGGQTVSEMAEKRPVTL